MEDLVNSTLQVNKICYLFNFLLDRLTMKKELPEYSSLKCIFEVISKAGGFLSLISDPFLNIYEQTLIEDIQSYYSRFHFIVISQMEVMFGRMLLFCSNIT